jgi:hypothetical protein
MGGAPGPVTTTSLTLVRVGTEKRDELLGFGPDGHHSATMSILPLARAGT